MKGIDLSNIIFTPGAAGVGTVNLSAIPNFNIRKLTIITNQTRNAVIYATGTSKGGTAITGSVITLSVDTTGHTSNDFLQVGYDSDYIYTRLQDASGFDISVGQKPASASLPVVIASDEILPIQNGEVIFSDYFGTFDTLSTWTLVSQASGDIVVIDGNAVASSWLDISLSPWDSNTSTVIESKVRFSIPIRMDFGVTRSLPCLGKEFAVEIGSDQTITSTTPIRISTVQQGSNTALLLSTFTPHGMAVGDSFAIDGMGDCRFNYPALVVGYVLSPYTLSANGGPAAATLGNTYTAAASSGGLSGMMYYRSRIGGSAQGTSMILENATATNASFYGRSDSGVALPMGGTLTSNHSVTIATTTPVQPVTSQYTYAFDAATQYQVVIRQEQLMWNDKTIDGTSVQTTRVKREKVVPAPRNDYKVRLRAVNNPGLTKITANVLKIDKGGAGVVSILTDRPHELTTASGVVYYGSPDQTNFSNFTGFAPVLSVVSSNVFQIASAGAVNTSYGGSIWKVNGGNLPSALGVITQTISGFDRTSNTLSISSANGAFSGFVVGDYLNIAGCISSTNTSCSIDGAYRVSFLLNTGARLEPINGAVSLTGADIPYTICGGMLVKRAAMRMHFIKAYKFNRILTEITGSLASQDQHQSAPVYISGANNASINISQIGGQATTTAGQNGTIAIGGNVGHGATANLNPVPLGVVDAGAITKRLLGDVAGGVSGPGEVMGRWAFSAAGAALTATDGTNSAQFFVPAKESTVYVGVSTIGTSNAATFQLEGSHNGREYSVIPLQRIDVTGANHLYNYAQGFSSVAGAVYKGTNWGYPILRWHQTAYSGAGNNGVIRVVPNQTVAGRVCFPFTFRSTANHEASGTFAGDIIVGSRRTVQIPTKGANKAIVQFDAVTGPCTIILEGSSDNGSTYQQLSVQPFDGGPNIGNITFVTATVTKPEYGTYQCDVSPYTNVRTRCTAYTSGSASGALIIESVPNNAGVDNSYKPTYAISVNDLQPTGVSNVLQLESGASKSTIIKQLIINPGVATAAGYANLTIAKVTGAGTGMSIGTPSFSPIPLSGLNRQDTDPLYSGTVRISGFNWSGSLSSATGIKIPLPTSITTATNPAATIVYDLTNGGTQKGLVIPVGTANGVLFQHSGLGGAASFGLTVEFTEE